jgi:endonuclease-3
MEHYMARETEAELKKRAGRIFAFLRKRHPDAQCALNHESPLQLLVATILAAQCTDARVNLVTPGLFQKYPTAKAFADARQEELEQEVRSTGFFRNKAKSIRGACARIVADYGGKVPDTMEALLTLPGVARKTANVVLGSAYGKNEGVVVDTHVLRVAPRLGLSRQKTPEKIERDLMALYPRKDWTLLGHILTFHGRRVCSARKPDCAGCPVNKLCPSAFKV